MNLRTVSIDNEVYVSKRDLCALLRRVSLTVSVGGLTGLADPAHCLGAATLAEQLDEHLSTL